MTEEVEGSYENQQHFISESAWNYKELMQKVAKETSSHLSGRGLVGCTVDEKSHLKKGKSSVGVARQYAGTIGKVDNCQVGVYLSLCAEKYSTISNFRLFMPKDWTEDTQRSRRAGVPDNIEYKTKPQLAIEMIKEHKKDGVHFDYVNGDGLYGNSYELSKALEAEQIPYVLDVHSNQRIYLEKPEISVPEKEAGSRGRKPSLLRANKQGIKVSDYALKLSRKDFKEIKIRRTTKGWLKALIHIANVWVWDEASGDTEPIQQTLVYRKPLKKNAKKEKPKYSLSNIHKDSQSQETFAFMQAQRFWIEKTFRDNSHDLGMSDYQVRKWKEWHNHVAMTAMAMLFVLQQRIKYNDTVPVLSYNDVRKLLIDVYANEGRKFDTKLEQMHKRHRQRASDMNRYYKNE